VTSGTSGADVWDGRTVVDEVDGDDRYEPETVVVIAVLLVACAAVALASLPVAIGLGVLPARLDELAIGILGLAVGIGGVLVALRWGAAAWDFGNRLLARRSAKLDAASAD
jgi:hypothetical protein